MLCSSLLSAALWVLKPAAQHETTPI